MAGASQSDHLGDSYQLDSRLGAHGQRYPSWDGQRHDFVNIQNRVKEKTKDLRENVTVSEGAD